MPLLCHMALASALLHGSFTLYGSCLALRSFTVSLYMDVVGLDFIEYLVLWFQGICQGEIYDARKP